MRKPLIWLLVLGAGLLVSPAFAQFYQNWWHVTPFNVDPNRSMDSSSIPVRQGTFNEWQRAMAPGFHNEWFYTWSATPYGVRGLYAGKIRNNGDTAWARTVNDGPDRQEDPVCMGTPDGGVILAWVDYRTGYYLGDTTMRGDGAGSIMAMKLDSSGNRLWVTPASDSIHAVPLCFVTGYQTDLRIIPDAQNGNGAYIFWEDTRNNLGQDVYGTRINASGQRYSGFRENGNPVVAASGNQPVNGEYTVDVDAHGGAWIAWTDNRHQNSDIYIQQMRGNGTTRWDSTGQPLDTTLGEQNKVKLAPDGRGGAFLVWRNAVGSDVNLYAQRIDSTGAHLWTPDSGFAGIPIGTWANEQTNPRIVYSSPDTCIISWEDFRNDPSGTNNEDIYAQKISGTASMQKLWNVDGVAACTQVDHQRENRICTDGTGGCVIVWQDERPNIYGTAAAPNEDSYAQRITTNGSVAWDVNGRVLAAYNGAQTFGVCRESGGHLLFMWSDTRKGSFPIYRAVWDLNGNTVGSVDQNGTQTVFDIAGNVSKNSVVKQGSTRVISFWVDGRNTQYGNRVYYFQTSADSGTPVTTVKNGIPVTIDSTNTITQDGTLIYSNPVTVGAPDSSAIVIYLNIVNGHYTMRAQKISYNGVRMWGPYGVEVCAQVTAPDYFSGSADGNGGAYFAYTIAGGAPDYFNEVHLQHIDANGNRLYSQDIGVDVSPGHEQTWAATAVSGSNVYLGLIEVYDIDYNLSQVRVMKINTDGSVNWTRTLATGFDTLGIGSIGSRSKLRLIPGSNGSVVAHWEEFRFDVANGSGQQIYAQKVDSDGTLNWGPNGIRLGATIQAESDAVATTAGNSYWFSWKDYRGINSSASQIYVQHLDENGSYLLDSLGLNLHTAPNQQTAQFPVADGGTGIYMAYTQYADANNPYPPPDTVNDADILSTHLLANGTVPRPDIWSPEPHAGLIDHLAYLVKMPAVQTNPHGLPIDGGAVYNWLDDRSTGKEEFVNLYIQRIRDDNLASVREVQAPVPQAFSLKQNYPNPFNSTTIIRFALPSTERVKLAVYDVLGREVVRLIDGVKMTGTYEVRWNSTNKTGEKVASGVYFYRMTTPKGSITKKMTLLN